MGRADIERLRHLREQLKQGTIDRATFELERARLLEELSLGDKKVEPSEDDKPQLPPENEQTPGEPGPSDHPSVQHNETPSSPVDTEPILGEVRATSPQQPLPPVSADIGVDAQESETPTVPETPPDTDGSSRLDEAQQTTPEAPSEPLQEREEKPVELPAAVASASGVGAPSDVSPSLTEQERSRPGGPESGSDRDIPDGPGQETDAALPPDDEDAAVADGASPSRTDPEESGMSGDRKADHGRPTIDLGQGTPGTPEVPPAVVTSTAGSSVKSGDYQQVRESAPDGTTTGAGRPRRDGTTDKGTGGGLKPWMLVGAVIAAILIVSIGALLFSGRGGSREQTAAVPTVPIEVPVAVSPTPTATPVPSPTPAPVLPGKLVVNWEPWARVSIAGRPGKTTPCSFDNLQPGTYHVKLTHPQLGTVNRTVTVQSGSTGRLTGRFEVPATLSINALPWARVEVDGVLKGNTPLKIKLSPGHHMVVLSNPAHPGADKSYAVNLKPAEERKLSHAF